MTIEQVKKLVRKNVLQLSPYSSARDEFEGTASIYLDANENPFNTSYNRYPDPHQRALKTRLAQLKDLPPDQIFIGNGSDEAIDLLIRVFCRPGESNVLIPQPSYGMYKVSADINDVAVKTVPLSDSFNIEVEHVLKNVDSNTRIIFLCSPNNPSGNLLAADRIENILNHFNGIVVVDEAYIDFTTTPGWSKRIEQFNNLVVLQTLSKAWGLASLRLGMAFSNTTIIGLLNKIKPPYNISGATQQLVLHALADPARVQNWKDEVIAERERLSKELKTISFIEHVYPSDANFILVRMTEARKKYLALLSHSIVVRDRSSVKLCENCLRITIGTKNENDQLLSVLKLL